MPRRIVELAEGCGAGLRLVDRASLAHAFRFGRGGLFLDLTKELYGWPR